MAAARALFIRERKLAREKGHKAHRNRVGSFALYLRVLDAGDAGATPTEMGAVPQTAPAPSEKTSDASGAPCGASACPTGRLS